MPATVDVSALTAALQAWADRVRPATEAGVQAAGEVVKEEIQANLSRSHYPPVSDPGSPPAYRSGFLHDEVYTRTVEQDTGYQERIFPSTVYARIQELSGWAGRGHRSFLPQRPYVRPARDAAIPQIASIMAAHWRGAQPGG